MYWVLTAKHAFDARELADLEPLWARGESQLLVLEGPPGSGRSRLLLEFVLEAKLAGTLVLMASASALRAETHGVADSLNAQLERLRPDLIEQLSATDREAIFGAQSTPQSGIRSRRSFTYRLRRASAARAQYRVPASQGQTSGGGWVKRRASAGRLHAQQLDSLCVAQGHSQDKRDRTRS